jgi:putative ABC transport system permease protein
VPVIETNANLAEGSERSFAVLGVDVLQDNNIRSYSVSDESADIPDPLLFLAKPDSILLTREMATREGIHIDQKIRVLTVQGLKTFTVRGLLEPDGPAKALGGDIAVMDIYAAQMAFGKEGRIDRIDVSMLRGETLDTMKGRIQTALPQGYYIDTPAGRTRQIENLMARFRNSMDFIGFMALFVGMYLIYNTVSISVVQRKREIGILRALGATQGGIIRLFLAETVALSLFASVLGVGLGVIFAKLSINAVAQTVSSMYGRSEVTELALPWSGMVKNVCIGILSSVVAAAFPARSSAHIAPVSAIRSTPFVIDGSALNKAQKLLSLSFLALTTAIIAVYKLAGPASPIRNSGTTTLAGLCLALGVSLATPLLLQRFIRIYRAFVAPRLGAGGRLAGLNLEKNLSRNAVAVAAVFFSISLSVGSASMLNSARMGVMDYIDAVDNSDIVITAGHPIASAGAQTIPMPLAMRQELEALPGVRNVDPFRKLFLNLSGKRVLLEAIDVVSWPKNNSCTVISGSLMKRGRDEVAVNETIASRLGLKQGDALVLPTPAGPRSFTVVAVIVSYASDSGVIFLDMPTYEKYWNDHVADMFSVYVEPGTDVTTARDAIRERFKETRKMFVLPALEFRQEIKKMLNRSVEMNDAVNVLTLLIAGFGIIVTLLASVLERTREIGILRSIGMTRGQVSGVVLIESALIGAAGGLLGIGAGVITGWINLEGFFRLDFGTSMAYHIHYPSIASGLLLSICLSVLAGLYPAHRAAKTNIVEALSYE